MTLDVENLNLLQKPRRAFVYGIIGLIQIKLLPRCKHFQSQKLSIFGEHIEFLYQEIC